MIFCWGLATLSIMSGKFGSSPKIRSNFCSLEEAYSIVHLLVPSLSSQATSLVLLRYFSLPEQS